MIHIEGLRKSFEKSKKPIIQDLSLNIEDGEFVVILGSNGAGKSTLMNLVAGQTLPDKGSIHIGASDVSNKREYQRARYIGRVFQNPNQGTCASRTIEENMILASKRGKKRLLGYAYRKHKRMLFKAELSKLGLGLEDRLHHRIGSLSGGQRQAITLLMAVLNKPDVLLLDEHTAALDPKIAQIVMEITNNLVVNKKISTLMITHNLEHAVRYGDRLILMHEGTIYRDIKSAEKKQMSHQEIRDLFYELNYGNLDCI